MQLAVQGLCKDPGLSLQHCSPDGEEPPCFSDQHWHQVDGVAKSPILDKVLACFMRVMIGALPQRGARGPATRPKKVCKLCLAGPYLIASRMDVVAWG